MSAPTPKRLARRRNYHQTTQVRMQIVMLTETRAQAEATRRVGEQITRLAPVDR